MTDRKQKLIDIFEDTQRFYSQSTKLASAVQASKAATKLYEADEYPGLPEHRDNNCTVAVTKHKTFEAAMGFHGAHPDWKIAVLNLPLPQIPAAG